MAVGKGSMERAAKAAEKKTEGTVTEKPVTAKAETAATEKAVAAKKSPAKKPAAKKAPAKKSAVASAKTIAALDKQVMEQVIYEHNSEMLERDAEPNENFGIGDAMPVYYF